MRGLVLEGGGAKGAFHCGAVKALYDYGLTFDGVAGTSIGAINGAMIVQEHGYERLLDLWTSISASEIANFDNMEVNKLFLKEYNKQTVSYWAKQAIKIIKNMGVPTDSFIDFLNKVLDENKIRQSNMDYAIVTYCLSDRKPLELFKEDIPYGELLNFVFASAYYPAFKMKRMSGKYYIDGGVYDNLPLNILPSKKGYEEIYAIRTMSRMPHKEIMNKNVNVHYICPSEDLGNTVNIYQQSINYKIKLGYYDALRYIKGYNGHKFYIKGSMEPYEKIFSILTPEIKQELINILNVKANEYETYISKKNVYEAKENNQLYLTNPYLAFLEDIAELYGVEKFNIYTPQTFIKSLLDKSVAEATKKDKLKDKDKKIQIYKYFLPKIKEINNGTK